MLGFWILTIRFMSNGVPITTDGGTQSYSQAVYISGVQYVAGIDYGNVVQVLLRPSATTYQLTGDLTCRRLKIGENAGLGTATLDTTANNYNITATDQF